jgi:hypothetical protein
LRPDRLVALYAELRGESPGNGDIGCAGIHQNAGLYTVDERLGTVMAAQVSYQPYFSPAA